MSELFPMKTMAIEMLQCTDASKMAEFNRWYDKKVIPSLRKLPGVVSIHRYIARDFDYGDMTPEFFRIYMEEPVRYMTIYRIHNEEPETVLEEIKAAREKMNPEYVKSLEWTLWDFFALRQRILPLMKQPQTQLPDGMPGMMLLIPNANQKKYLDEIDDWWLYTHANDLMKTPGYVQCSRYHNISPSYEDGDSTAVNFYEIDSDDPVTMPLIKNMKDDQIRETQGRIPHYMDHPKPNKTYMCGVFQHWDITSAF